MNAKELKDKLKEVELESVRQVCDEMVSQSLPTDEWRKVFTKAILQKVVKHDDIRLIVTVSSAFWKQDPELWESFFEIFEDAKSRLTTKRLLGLVKEGDERSMTMVGRIMRSNPLKVGGVYDEYGTVEIDNALDDMDLAKKLAEYTGPIQFDCMGITAEVADVLAKRTAPVYPGYLGGDPVFEYYEIPVDSAGFENLVKKIVASCEGELALQLQSITPEIASIISTFRGNSIRMYYLTEMSIGVAKRLAKWMPSDPDSSFSYLEVGSKDRESPMKIAPGALAEFRDFSTKLMVNALEVEWSENDAQGLGELIGSLSLGLSEFPPGKTVSCIIRNKTEMDFGFIPHGVLDPEIAGALSGFTGKKMYLNGIEEITDEVAVVLSGLGSKLKIANVDEISDSARKTMVDAGVDVGWC